MRHNNRADLPLPEGIVKQNKTKKTLCTWQDEKPNTRVIQLLPCVQTAAMTTLSNQPSNNCKQPAPISGQDGLQTRHPWWAYERANTNVSQTLRLPPAGLQQSAAQLSHCQNKSSKWLNVYSSSWLGCAMRHLFRLTPSCFFFFFSPLTAITLFRYFRRKSHITRLCLTWTDCQITFWMLNIRLTGYSHKTSFPKLFFSLVLPLKFLYLPTGGKFDLRRHKAVTRIACEIKIIYASLWQSKSNNGFISLINPTTCQLMRWNAVRNVLFGHRRKGFENSLINLSQSKDGCITLELEQADDLLTATIADVWLSVSFIIHS